MHEVVLVLLFVAAAAAGGISVWLFLKSRLRQAAVRAEERLAEARRSAEELVAYREKRLEELKENQRHLEAEEEKLREALRCETGKRAAAEEKCQRIPLLEQQLAKRETALEKSTSDNSRLTARLSEMETRLADERRSAEEKLKLLTEAKEQLGHEFQNLANRIFEDKSRKFTDQNRENLEGVLNPVREQLKDFKKRVEDVYEKEAKDRVSLFHEITNLKNLNQRISEDAINLTNALKGQSKTQGAWGEVILERILEESGLRRGHEYDTQESYGGEDGRHRRPDVIVRLPENKDVVIDAKVSLTAYERYCGAGEDKERERELNRHILSLRTHVKSLSEKKYEDLPGVRTLDFVLMFLPIEGAFLLAMEHDAGLFNEAMEKNILMVSPSTLLATLRTIDNIWRYEYQNRNAQLIARKAGDLYDKFVGFVEALEDVGSKIGKAREAYETARNRLTDGRGNLVRRTLELQELGVKSRKSLPTELVESAGGAEE